MLTPTQIWRVPKTLQQLEEFPPREFEMPSTLMQQSNPPKVGDGILLADYDTQTQTGIVRYLGLIQSRKPACVEVDWVQVNAEIWVDTPTGRRYWASPNGFKFASNKVAGYGLHQLFAQAFPDLKPREVLPDGATAPHAARSPRPRSGSISQERFEPIEIVGEPTESPRGGYVYVLQSAYGYKIGRTRNLPSRMRTFGVKLPIMYTIPLCAWFDDHIEAEAMYHRLFAEKRINGEWFNLEEQDIALIRSRQYQWL